MAKSNITIFTEMSALAQEHDAINLSQGFPDFELDSQLGNFLIEGFNAGYNQYAPMAGLPLLRQSIAETILAKYNIKHSSDNNITITPGASYAIYTALASFIKPDDEVIILEPAYDSYAPNITSLGGQVVPVALNKKDFRVDWQKVTDAVTTKTSAIIINSPHNPTGTLWKTDDYIELKKLVRDTEIRIISDEVYEYLSFDGLQHYSLMQDQELFERTYCIFSFGKMIQATGWKIGYVVAPPNFTKDFRNAHQYIGFSVNSISQYAIGRYLQINHGLDKLSGFFETKRDLMLSVFAALPFIVPIKSQGSYFQVFSFDGVSDLGDRAFAYKLTKEAKVASIPLSPFYQDETDNKMLRFCFAKHDKTIISAAENLQTFFSK